MLQETDSTKEAADLALFSAYLDAAGMHTDCASPRLNAEHVIGLLDAISAAAEHPCWRKQTSPRRPPT